MEKIKDEQLEKIQQQQKDLNAILHEVGVLETRKHGLMHQFAGINQEVEELKAELEQQYGAVNINVEDGTSTEIEKEEVKAGEEAISHV